MYDLIKKYEGCKLKAYKCPAGVWTIGWGNTYYKDKRPVKEGDTITQKGADDLLQWYCSTQVSLPPGLTQGQQEALYSLIYNIGQTAFDKSKVKAAILAKDWRGMWKEYDWITACGQFLKGLAKRRAEELLLFFS